MGPTVGGMIIPTFSVRPGWGGNVSGNGAGNNKVTFSIDHLGKACGFSSRDRSAT